MKFFSSKEMSNKIGSVFSTLAIAAVTIGAIASPFFVPVASANNGLPVSAVPNSGTLTVGQSLEIRVSDPSGTTDAVSDSCLVNNVDVNSTFRNEGPGDYRYTYTVGAGDQNRTAGTVPINCTLRQAVTLTVNAFDDNNTVAINTSGNTTDTAAPTIASTNPANNATNVAVGSTIQVTFNEPMDQSTLNSNSFTVRHAVGGAGGSITYSGNTATFTPQVPLLENTAYTITITTDAKDAAGNAIANTYTSTFTTGGTGNGGNATTSLNFTVGAVPSTGTLSTGQQLEVYFDEAGNDANVTLDGACTVNGTNVASSFQNLTGGLYKVIYVVGASDTNRAAGQVPVTCSLKNTTSGATANLAAFTDSNTVAIQTGSNNGGAVAPTISMTSMSPNSGMLVAGNTVTVTFSEGNSQSDLTLTGSCLLNAKDVSSSWHSTGGGQYVATYTIQAGDGERPAGHMPISCTMGNSAGNVTANAWLDNNTVSIDTNGDGNIDNGTSTLGFTISANPSTGTLHAGDSVTIDLQDPLPSGDVTADFCRVNDVDVKPSYTYVGNGLYRVTYTVQAGDAIRAAGQIPFDCTLRNHTGSVHLVNFTDGNALAVDPTTSGNGGNNGGNNGTSTDHSTIAFTVGAVPSTGTLAAGQNLEVYFEETSDDLKIELNGACTVNNVDVSNTFQNLTGGLYKVTYTIGASDASRAAGTVPVSCAVHDWHTLASTTIVAFTDNNTIAINAGTSTGNNNGTSTGGTIGGGVTGGNNGTTTNGYLHVDSIQQVRDTATAGGGYSQGWAWVFHITVPSNETSLSMKFDDWTHSNGSDELATANNMRIWSSQAATSTPTSVGAAGTYTDAMTLTGDLDANTPGRQIEVTVEMQVPSNTLNGSYTTNYGVRSI